MPINCLQKAKKMLGIFSLAGLEHFRPKDGEDVNVCWYPGLEKLRPDQPRDDHVKLAI